MAATLYGVEGDTEHVETFVLRIANEGVPITETVTCVQVHVSTGAVLTSAVCTPDADQVTNPGRFTVTFGATELQVGTWTLEFEHDGRTFPGRSTARPLLEVRPDENEEEA